MSRSTMPVYNEQWRKDMKSSIMVAVVVALLLTLACVTVNVYFPAAEVQSAAGQIVGEVYGQAPPSSAPEGQAEHSMLKRTLRDMLPVAREAYAAINIDISTPNIRALRGSLEERFKSLKPLYEKGIIGITNDGMLAIRSQEGLSLEEKANVNRLVKADNADREDLYAEIAKANNLDPATIPDIKKLFAVEWRAKAQKGWWVQKDNGEWVKKDSQ